MDQKLNIVTTPIADGTIKQELFIEVDGVRESIMRSILDTRDVQIKKALVALGWTPPKEEI